MFYWCVTMKAYVVYAAVATRLNHCTVWLQATNSKRVVIEYPTFLLLKSKLSSVLCCLLFTTLVIIPVIWKCVPLWEVWDVFTQHDCLLAVGFDNSDFMQPQLLGLEPDLDFCEIYPADPLQGVYSHSKLLIRAINVSISDIDFDATILREYNHERCLLYVHFKVKIL